MRISTLTPCNEIAGYATKAKAQACAEAGYSVDLPNSLFLEGSKAMGSVVIDDLNDIPFSLNLLKGTCGKPKRVVGVFDTFLSNDPTVTGSLASHFAAGNPAIREAIIVVTVTNKGPEISSIQYHCSADGTVTEICQTDNTEIEGRLVELLSTAFKRR